MEINKLILKKICLTKNKSNNQLRLKKLQKMKSSQFKNIALQVYNIFLFLSIKSIKRIRKQEKIDLKNERGLNEKYLQ